MDALRQLYLMYIEKKAKKPSLPLGLVKYEKISCTDIFSILIHRADKKIQKPLLFSVARNVMH